MTTGKTKRPVFFAIQGYSQTRQLDHSRPEKTEDKVPSGKYWNPGK
jgi:hypothetical protein